MGDAGKCRILYRPWKPNFIQIYVSDELTKILPVLGQNHKLPSLPVLQISGRFQKHSEYEFQDRASNHRILYLPGYLLNFEKSILPNTEENAIILRAVDIRRSFATLPPLSIRLFLRS